MLLRSSTCFEQHAAHPQEDKLYHHSLWYRHPLWAAAQYAGGERTAVRSPPAYCTAARRVWRYQRLWWYNLSSWEWAACCSKHVEEQSNIYIYIYIYILLKNKRIVHLVGNLKKSVLICPITGRESNVVFLECIQPHVTSVRRELLLSVRVAATTCCLKGLPCISLSRND